MRIYAVALSSILLLILLCFILIVFVNCFCIGYANQIYIKADNVQEIPFRYNNVEWRLFIFNISYGHHDMYYLNSYVYIAENLSDWLNKDPQGLFIRSPLNNRFFTSKMLKSFRSRIEYNELANGTRRLFEKLGFDVKDIYVGLDAVLVVMFNSSTIKYLNESIVDEIFDIYMNCKTLRREIAVTMAIGKGYNLTKARRIADQIMNMSIDEVYDRFKVIVIHMPVTREEYERYYNETLNRFLELSEQGVKPKWITSIGESMFGTIVIIIRLDILEKNGLTIKDAVEYLRNISGNNYPLQVVVFPTEQFEVLLDKSDRAIYPIEHLYIILGAITITAISLALYKRKNLIK